MPTLAERPQVWTVLTFMPEDAMLAIRNIVQSRVTGQITLNLSQGCITTVELKARPTDPGFQSLSSTGNK